MTLGNSVIMTTVGVTSPIAHQGSGTTSGTRSSASAMSALKVLTPLVTSAPFFNSASSFFLDTIAA